ncbi:MAG TPA: divalent-cation tolerance protein CutA [Candidatus Limnocylindria bacterium]
MPGEELIQLQTTVASRLEGERIGQAVVDARLAACAQLVGPIQSRYRWHGEATVSREWVLLFKARRADWDALTTEIRRLHSYDVPELIATPVLEVSADYAAWVTEGTTRTEG